MAPGPMEESEEEFWQEENSGERDFWKQALHQADVEDGVLHRARLLCTPMSSPKPKSPSKKRSKPKRMAEKGVATDVASGVFKRKRKNITSYGTMTQTSSTSQSEEERYYTAEGSDADEKEVVDTDVDPTPPQTQESSFAFSTQFPSRATSMTSVSTVSSLSSASSKKRTLDYADVFAGPSSPGPRVSIKARKKTRQMDSSSTSSIPRDSTSTLHVPAPLRFPPPACHSEMVPLPQITPSPSRPESVNSAATTMKGDDPQTPSKAAPLNASAQISRTDRLRQSITIALQSASKSSTSAIRASAADPVIIAHSRNVQAMLDAEQVSWGVQYEIARGICSGLWTWQDVTMEKLERLRGPNQMAAPRVHAVMLSRASDRTPVTDMPLWIELDREQAALADDPTRGLGLQGEWQGEANWYGGRIQQVARLVKQDKGAPTPYTVVLEKMLKRKSTRFARFLGSRRVLQVSIPQELMRGAEVSCVRDFLAQRFVLCGRVFVSFATKEHKVFMMETNEDFERVADSRGDQHRISLEQFVDWHNPLALNAWQPTSKWITRFELGLSTSMPVLRFRGVGIDIEYIDDLVAPYHSSLKKAPTENIFTDGCGYMNGAALTAIGRLIGYSERPTVVQGRFAGSKGLWALHPEDQEPNALPRMWIRSSQQKIKHHDEKLGPAQLTFDLVAPPRITIPARLSMYTIMNLSHNGVPDETFIKLMQDGLKKEVEALTTWDGPHAMVLLWHAVNQVGHVTLSKLRQQAAGGARILGFGRAQDRDDWEDDDVDDGLEDETLEVGSLEYEGEPTSVSAAVLELLQAGFQPLKLPLLYEKLRKVVADRIEDYIRNYKITVPRSAEAFIIPDPYGVLEEGQIHFKSTQNLKDPLEESNPTIVTGDVLIYRNPTRVPSDVRKVKAVSHPKLDKYVNVIVLPVKGSRSLANILAGGDVDGDVCTCIFDPDLVDSFENSPINDPPPGFKETFFEAEGSIEQVFGLKQRLAELGNPSQQIELSKVLLSGLSEVPIGLYSTMHENTAYAFGFCTVLDSRKTGLRVKDGVFKKDKQQYDKEKPDCMTKSSTASTVLNGPYKSRLRRQIRRRFVLETLLDAGRTLQSELLAKYDGMRADLAQQPDNDLLRPYQQASRLATTIATQGLRSLQSETTSILEHVHRGLQAWRSLSSKSPQSPAKASPSKSRVDAKAKAEKGKPYKDLAISFMRDLHNVPHFAEFPVRLDAILASCAYQENPKFAFSVAFRSLCKIKAEASGSAALSRTFAEVMTVPSAAVKVLSQT
ncbi:hypothetical protein POSPLADRAFT_1127992 [Postia placenta MAD-698-R-SB12]|uniref:RNA-dependent RNA polymerase n=1 Tax=Postia placenta MAD-698-R-SB12 TaxID=670580 RepID=A0A1X6NFA9_9APHY|nr:hypothetical protein POSPLADRAFT_1127992 [Postia placenta MAD-698-R-SB12]OSX67200.1 hypothetical protein POSPLADRAFT_1127992 [Postia placenta MAD-698-R-SB12]